MTKHFSISATFWRLAKQQPRLQCVYAKIKNAFEQDWFIFIQGLEFRVMPVGNNVLTFTLGLTSVISKQIIKWLNDINFETLVQAFSFDIFETKLPYKSVISPLANELLTAYILKQENICVFYVSHSLKSTNRLLNIVRWAYTCYNTRIYAASSCIITGVEVTFLFSFDDEEQYVF